MWKLTERQNALLLLVAHAKSIQVEFYLKITKVIEQLSNVSYQKYVCIILQ